MTSINFLQWSIPWEPSILVVAITLISATLYVRGCFQQHQNGWRKLCFWLGLALLYIASHTDFDYYSEHAFFMHRIQHSVLHHMGPFLIALSRPGAALAAGLSANRRRQIENLLRFRPISLFAAFMNNPGIAVFLFVGLIIFWLIPPIHFIAMLDWRLYRIMNWSMAINGLMFWNLVLNNYALRPAHLSPACRIGVMLAVIPAQIVIGMLIFVMPHELYPLYKVCGYAFPGMSASADQQLGGLILWIPAAMMSVIGILVVIKREWMSRTSDSPL